MHTRRNSSLFECRARQMCFHTCRLPPFGCSSNFSSWPGNTLENRECQLHEMDEHDEAGKGWIQSIYGRGCSAMVIRVDDFIWTLPDLPLLLRASILGTRYLWFKLNVLLWPKTAIRLPLLFDNVTFTCHNSRYSGAEGTYTLSPAYHNLRALAMQFHIQSNKCSSYFRFRCLRWPYSRYTLNHNFW